MGEVQTSEVQSSSVQGGDDGTYLAALYHFRGREERVVFYESLVFDTLDAHTWIWSDLHR